MASGGAPDQLVYLSNRPAVLAETLGYVRHFMPWVREAVVLTPAAGLAEMRSTTAQVEGMDVVLVDETTVLSADEQRSLSALHHGDRNTLLRRALLTRGPVDDVFLQSDDDYRPLKPIATDVFTSDGRIVPYACHDLALYRRNESPFDRVQHVSYLVLSYLGADHLCFASHMPQALDKALTLEAFAVAEKLTGGTEFDEWSLPINYGRLLAPELYSGPRTFRTMCWPQYPHEWPYWRRPEDLSFENFYPELYEKGRLFAGISTALDQAAAEQQAFTKIDRWYAFDLEAGRLRFPKGVDNPWQTSAGRRLFFWSARRARKLYEYAALEERTQLAELAGAIERLERRSP